jgi:hypothetical protein
VSHAEIMVETIEEIIKKILNSWNQMKMEIQHAITVEYREHNTKGNL